MSDNKIIILDSFNKLGEVESELNNYSDVQALCYSQNGKFLFSGNKNGKIVVYSTDNGEELLNYETNSNEIMKIEISPDNKYLITIDTKGKMKIFSLHWH